MIGLVSIAWVAVTPVVHASILGDTGRGYQDGKQAASDDFHAGRQFHDAPAGTTVIHFNLYEFWYQAGYDWEWAFLKIANP